MADVWFSTYKEGQSPKLAAIIGDISDETPAGFSSAPSENHERIALNHREVEVLRLLVQGYIYYKAMKKLQEEDLFAWWWLLDIWMFAYYIIFAPTLWKKPRPNWN